MKTERVRPYLLHVSLFLLFSMLSSDVAFLCAAEPDLAARLMPLIDAHKGKVAVAIKQLDSGEAFAYRADDPMPTASLIKLAVMVEAYRQVEAKQIDLAKPLTLREADKVPGSGILTSHFSSGATFSLRDAIRLMIVFSDNTATNLVLDEIGLEATAKQMETLGLPNTKLHAKVYRPESSIFPERSKQFGLGSTTAAEMVQLLEMLHQRKLGSPKACEEMLSHLKACDDEKKLLRLLPAGIKVAHKSGSLNAVRTEAGLIYAPQGPIAVCVLTAENEDQSWGKENTAERLCGEIAKAAYDFFNPR